MNAPRRHWVVFLLSWVAMNGVAYGYWRSLDGQVRAQRAARRTYTGSVLTLIDVLDVETGLRGHLVAGRKEFLRPYHEGLGRLDGHLGMLAAQVSDLPDELRAYRQVREDVGAILAEFGAEVDLVESGGLAAGVARFQGRPTKPLMDRVRANLALIAAEEEAKLDRGRDRVDRTMATLGTLMATLLAVTAGVVLVLLSGLIPAPGSD